MKGLWQHFRQLDAVWQVSVCYLAIWLIFHAVRARTTRLLPLSLHLHCVPSPIPLFLYIVPLWKAVEASHIRSPVRKVACGRNGFTLSRLRCPGFGNCDRLFSDFMVMDSARAMAGTMRGTFTLFCIGLLWSDLGVGTGLGHPTLKTPPPDQREVLDPLDLRAHFYAVHWWPPRVVRPPTLAARDREVAVGFSRSNTGSAIVLHSRCFSLVFFRNCAAAVKIYEMPARGGEAKNSSAQIVKIKKVDSEKVRLLKPAQVAIKLQRARSTKVQLKLEEKRQEHAYTVGYAKGTGAGFAGGTFRGKVRFIPPGSTPVATGPGLPGIGGEI